MSESKSDVTSLPSGMGWNPILAQFAPCCTGFQLLVCSVVQFSNKVNIKMSSASC